MFQRPLIKKQCNVLSGSLHTLRSAHMRAVIKKHAFHQPPGHEHLARPLKTNTARKATAHVTGDTVQGYGPTFFFPHLPPIFYALCCLEPQRLPPPPPRQKFREKSPSSLSARLESSSTCWYRDLSPDKSYRHNPHVVLLQLITGKQARKIPRFMKPKFSPRGLKSQARVPVLITHNYPITLALLHSHYIWVLQIVSRTKHSFSKRVSAHFSRSRTEHTCVSSHDFLNLFTVIISAAAKRQ
jgi:hypothetical protein